jgi:hypothetical protein
MSSFRNLPETRDPDNGSSWSRLFVEQEHAWIADRNRFARSRRATPIRRGVIP